MPVALWGWSYITDGNVSLYRQYGKHCSSKHQPTNQPTNQPNKKHNQPIHQTNKQETQPTNQPNKQKT